VVEGWPPPLECAGHGPRAARDRIRSVRRVTRAPPRDPAGGAVRVNHRVFACRPLATGASEARVSHPPLPDFIKHPVEKPAVGQCQPSDGPIPGGRSQGADVAYLEDWTSSGIARQRRQLQGEACHSLRMLIAHANDPLDGSAGAVPIRGTPRQRVLSYGGQVGFDTGDP